MRTRYQSLYGGERCCGHVFEGLKQDCLLKYRQALAALSIMSTSFQYSVLPYGYSVLLIIL